MMKTTNARQATKKERIADMYSIKPHLSEDEVKEISRLYDQLKNVSVLQHPLWPNNLNEAQDIKFLLKRENGKIVLSAKVIESKLRRAPFIRYAHIFYGPLSDNPGDIAGALEYLAEYYSKQKFAGFSAQLTCSLSQAQFVEHTILKGSQSFFYGPHEGFKVAVAVPLHDDIEKIYASFSACLKRNINTALKTKISVQVVTSKDEFEKFLPIYAKMEASRGINLHSHKQLSDIFEFITATNLGQFLAAYNKNGIMVGGMFLLREGNKVEYLIGGTDPEYKNLQQSHLTFYEAIKQAKLDGFEFFDLGGYKFSAKKGDQVFNINTFKLNFTDNILFYPRLLNFRTNITRALIGKVFLRLATYRFKRS